MELYLTDAVRYSFAATWRDLDAPGHAESVPIDADIAPSTYPQPKPLNPRKIEDYPDVPPAYRAVAQRYAGPLLVGPPICDELIALIQHLFTEEEAALVQHLTFPTGKTAPALAATVTAPWRKCSLSWAGR